MAISTAAQLCPGPDPALIQPAVSKASKYRLTELPGHAVPSVLAATAFSEKDPGNPGQAKGIGKLPAGEQSSVRDDPGTVEIKLEATVETDQKNLQNDNSYGDSGNKSHFLYYNIRPLEMGNDFHNSNSPEAQRVAGASAAGVAS